MDQTPSLRVNTASHATMCEMLHYALLSLPTRPSTATTKRQFVLHNMISSLVATGKDRHVGRLCASTRVFNQLYFALGVKRLFECVLDYGDEVVLRSAVMNVKLPCCDAGNVFQLLLNTANGATGSRAVD